MFKLLNLRSWAYLFVTLSLFSGCATQVPTTSDAEKYTANLDLGLRYAAQNQWELARNSFARYSRAAQEDNNVDATVNGLINRAVSLRSLGQNHFAHYLMHEAFDLAPERQTLDENHATGLLDIGEFGKAESELSALIDGAKAGPDIYHARGLTRLQAGVYSGALNDFSSELELNPFADTRCFEIAKSLQESDTKFEVTGGERQQIESIFESHKEAMRLNDGDTVLKTLSKVWLDSYFSLIKRNALLASADEMNGLEVFDAMLVYYLRNHYFNDPRGLRDQLPLDLFTTMIEQGWIKSELKKVVDGEIVFDATIASYQPILRSKSCSGFYSVYATFDGSLAGWKQNFEQENDTWYVSSRHLIDIFRMISAEYSQSVYDGGSALWIAYSVVEKKLSDQEVEFHSGVAEPLMPDLNLL